MIRHDRARCALQSGAINMWPFDMFSKKMKYVTTEAGSYYSPRYNKTISWPGGYPHDGATMAPDLDIRASRVHDRICEVGTWDCGTPITRIEASNVYSDILESCGQRKWSDGKWLWLKGKYIASTRYHRKYLTYWFGAKKLRRK